jgi:HK97 family phage major capsid protein
MALVTLKDHALREQELGKQLHEIFEQAGETNDMSKVTSIDGDSKQKTEKIQELSKELETIVAERIRLQGVENDKARAKAAAEGKTVEEIDAKQGIKEFPSMQSKGWMPQDYGKLIVAHDQFKREGGIFHLPDIDLNDIKVGKTVFRTGAGWDPEDIRIPRVILDAQRPAPVISDLLPQIPTTMSTVLFMEETTFTNNAAEVAESTATTDADLYGEAALALTEQSSEVRKIAVFIPVTDEQMEDVPGAEAYVRQRLGFMLDQRLDLQIVTGDGSAPNLEGTNNVTGILTQAKSTDSEPDAIYKAMRQVRVTGRANPSLVIIHPNDWETIRLLTTADGIYIWGPPMDNGPMRIWGVPVVESDAATENTVTLGDYQNFSALYTRRGVDIQVSNSHNSYFTRGMQAIRADVRVALVHFRPAAFANVTGM